MVHSWQPRTDWATGTNAASLLTPTLCQAMGHGAEEQLQPAATAAAFFTLLDADGSGMVRTAHLRAGLEEVPGSGLSAADLSDAMDLFDPGRLGAIDKRAFVQALQAMREAAA